MGEPSEALQFDRAESTGSSGAGAGGLCPVCQRSFGGEYFEVNRRPACASCKAAIVRTFSGPLRGPIVVRALGWGILGAIGGSALFFAVRAITGYELGLVGVVVGLLVGYGVRKGCFGRGGWFYQAMAMLLTYLAIVSTYIPSVLRVLNEGEGATIPVGRKLIAAVVFSLLEPFLAGFQNLMGLAIIGFALYEAWKLNRPIALDVKGPFTIAR